MNKNSKIEKLFSKQSIDAYIDAFDVSSEESVFVRVEFKVDDILFTANATSVVQQDLVLDPGEWAKVHFSREASNNSFTLNHLIEFSQTLKSANVEHELELEKIYLNIERKTQPPLYFARLLQNVNPSRKEKKLIKSKVKDAISYKSVLVDIFNVGQGNACFFGSFWKSGSPCKKKGFFFDVGNKKSRGHPKWVLPSFKNTAVDLVFISHWDQDHWGGLRDIFDAGIKTLFIVSPNEPSLAAQGFIKLVRNSGRSWIFYTHKKIKIKTKSLDFIIGQGIGSNRNNRSLIIFTVLKGKGKNRTKNRIKALFPADCGYDKIESEIGLLSRENLNLLVASHHGGRCGNLSVIPGASEKHKKNLIVYSTDGRKPPGHPLPNERQGHQAQGWIDEIDFSNANFSSLKQVRFSLVKEPSAVEKIILLLMYESVNHFIFTEEGLFNHY